MGKTCQVEGCQEDLEALGRPYFLKKKICEQHMRAEVVERISGGVKLWRFCQQCGKLEPLSSFDGLRRNCRSSLRKRRNHANKTQDSEGCNNQNCTDSTKGPQNSDVDYENPCRPEYDMQHDGCGLSEASAGSYGIAAAAPEDVASCRLPTVAPGMDGNMGAAAVATAAATAAGADAMYQPMTLDVAWMDIQQQQRQQQQMHALQSSMGIADCGSFDGTLLQAGLNEATGAYHIMPGTTASTGQELRNRSVMEGMTAAVDATARTYTGSVSSHELEAVMMQELLAVLNEGGASASTSLHQPAALHPLQQQQQLALPAVAGLVTAAPHQAAGPTMLPAKLEPLLSQLSVSSQAVGCGPTAAFHAGRPQMPHQRQLSDVSGSAAQTATMPLATACSIGSCGFRGVAAPAAAAAVSAAGAHRCSGAIPVTAAQQRKACMASRLQLLNAQMLQMQQMLANLQKSVTDDAARDVAMNFMAGM